MERAAGDFRDRPWQYRNAFAVRRYIEILQHAGSQDWRGRPRMRSAGAEHIALDAIGRGHDAIIASEQAAGRVNAAYAIDGERTAEGVRPAHIKERIRALGPTVRPDLTLKPADPTAGDWVI